jgi:hypothetical protein
VAKEEIRNLRLKMDALIENKKKKENDISILVSKKGLSQPEEFQRQKLVNELAVLDNEINQTREWYNTLISNSLYEESIRLNKLTIALIFLTAILSIFTIVDFILRVIH